jgi:hypothetical protein
VFAEAKHLKGLTVDICAGADFHRAFGDEPRYFVNVVSVTEGGTYGEGTPTFGCELDTPENTRGEANIRQEDFSFFDNPRAPRGPQLFTEIYFDLSDGQIVVRGLSKVDISGNGFTDVDLPVIGGTGAFAGIHGVAHLVALNGPEARVTFETSKK